MRTLAFITILVLAALAFGAATILAVPSAMLGVVGFILLALAATLE